MLSCQKASALIDKRPLFGLTSKEKIMLKMHTVMCDACTAYVKQSELIDQLMHTHIHTDNESELPVAENADLKKRIISKF